MTTGFKLQTNGIMQIDKAPDEVLDYTLDWSQWLQSGETIASFTAPTPTGLTNGGAQSGLNAAANAVIVWLASGTTGTIYPITVEIITTAGRTAERSFQVRAIAR